MAEDRVVVVRFRTITESLPHLVTVSLLLWEQEGTTKATVELLQ